MLVRREKIITKSSQGEYQRTSYWLFGIIPLYICNKLVRPY